MGGHGASAGERHVLCMVWHIAWGEVAKNETKTPIKRGEGGVNGIRGCGCCMLVVGG